MKIDRIRPRTLTSLKVTKGAQDVKDFSVSESVPLTSVEKPLAAGVFNLTQRQEFDVLLPHAENILDRLDHIRVALLNGNLSLEHLDKLESSLKQQRQQATNPQLEELIAHVELRGHIVRAQLKKRQ